MPDTDREDDTQPATEAVAKQPDTDAERRQKHLAAIESESHEARSIRRAAEFKRQRDAHTENVASAHEKFPAPLKLGSDSTVEDVERWNQRRTDIDMANRAYHLAVRRTFAAHQDEDNHLAGVAAKSAA